MVENSWSKSTLICAAHSLIKELSSFVDYFPSYEIFNDELRCVDLDRQSIYFYDVCDFDVLIAVTFTIVVSTVSLIKVVTIIIIIIFRALLRILALSLLQLLNFFLLLQGLPMVR